MIIKISIVVLKLISEEKRYACLKYLISLGAQPRNDFDLIDFISWSGYNECASGEQLYITVISHCKIIISIQKLDGLYLNE